jgi:D-glycero-alpha-D-manno-heptose-7-phosphate kinase
MNRAFNLMLTKYDMARIAYQVEHDDLGHAVGRQDHCATVFGGMNFMEFTRHGTVVYPLRVEPWILEELGYHLQMFYTRKKRDSTDLVATQVEYYRSKRQETLDALAAMKDLTRQMQKALLQGRLRAFGELLDLAWREKRRMNPTAVTPYLDELYAAARDSGAVGGKIMGAGGGGFFIFYTPFMKKGRVAEALGRLGAQAVPFVLDFNGLQTWQVGEQRLADESDGIYSW